MCGRRLRIRVERWLVTAASLLGQIPFTGEEGTSMADVPWLRGQTRAEEQDTEALPPRLECSRAGG